MTKKPDLPHDVMYSVVTCLGALQHVVSAVALQEKPDQEILNVLEKHMDFLIDTVFDGEVGVRRPATLTKLN